MYDIENYFNAEVRCINEIMSYKMIWKKGLTESQLLIMIFN